MILYGLITEILFFMERLKKINAYNTERTEIHDDVSTFFI